MYIMHRFPGMMTNILITCPGTHSSNTQSRDVEDLPEYCETQNREQ